MRWVVIGFLVCALSCLQALGESEKETAEPVGGEAQEKVEEEVQPTVSWESLKKAAREAGYSIVKSGGLIYIVPPGREGDVYEEAQVVEVYALENPGSVRKKEMKRVFGAARSGSGG